MFLRTTRAQRKEYVQLAHTVREPGKRHPQVKVLYSFGRKDRLDLDALRRLVRSISRFLPAAEVAEIQDALGMDWPLEYLGSRRLGGSWLLDGLWRRLGMKRALKKLVQQREYRSPIERLLFALVANRALAPASKLAMETWVAKDTWIEDLPEVEVHSLYRAMDFLLEAHETIQREVFWNLANLLNLEVDVLFLDTTSVYFEIDGEDEDAEGAEGLRKRGYSKDHRPGQAQAVVGFAVTREGIPVRCWVWPGNTSDQDIIAAVKRDLNDWKLGRILTVLDTGFNSTSNRRILRGAGDHYIIGEKLRLGPHGKLPEALQRGGKYQVLKDGLAVKEVITQRASTVRQRFVVVANPQEAAHDQQRREDIISHLEQHLAALEQLDGEPHTKKACWLRAHPAFGRYLRQTKTGKLRIDKGKIRKEARLDGTFLVRTSDPDLPAADVAKGYKQLWRIERVHRDLKHTVDIRPVYHRLEDRIRAHTLLCWLALLLIRVAEAESGYTWHQIRTLLAGLDVGIHRMRGGEVWMTSPVSKEQRELFASLKLKSPTRYLQLPAPKRTSA